MSSMLLPSSLLIELKKIQRIHVILQHLLAAWPGSFTVDLPYISHALAIKNSSSVLSPFRWFDREVEKESNVLNAIW